MEPSRPQFEVVFEVRDSVLIRRSVRDIGTGKVEVDDTRYRILSDLISYKPEALQFKRLRDELRPLSPVLRAIGRPGADAVEILFVGPDWIQAVKTVRDYVVIQRYVRSQ